MDKNKQKVKPYKDNYGVKSGITIAVIWVVWVALMYYLLLPALNVHSAGMWMFLILVCLVPAALGMLLHQLIKNSGSASYNPVSKKTGVVFGTAACAMALFLLLLLFGAPMFHASAYASILKLEDYDFNEDINQATAVTNIALMDTDSAILLGNREIGGLSEVVSQYNVSDSYSQIDYSGSPVKVSALNYAGFFKYMGNKESGVPGYVKVDPVGQNAEYVAVDEGMKYVPSAYFGKDLKRHIRMQYPTKIFGNLHFEINEDGAPYYVASVYDYTIGVFGGETVQGAIVCDPISGECVYYAAAEVPQWVDNVFEGDLLVKQYDWYGKLSNGFMNSIFGKKGCKKCTETIEKNADDEDEDEDASYAADYGYVSKDGDIWIYTGVTSVNDDASNIGFILVNERTSEAHYYTIAGADESSAMSAAEGEVQEKGYQASFPSLINVDNQPTYIMVLKDASGIVKLYAMVNVESYNMVTTATDIDECFSKYRKLMGTEEASEDSGTSDETIENDDALEDENAEIIAMDFVIQSIQYVDIEGNTYVYLAGEDGNVYRQRFADNEKLIFLNPGDSVSADCIFEEDGVYRIKTTR